MTSDLTLTGARLWSPNKVSNSSASPLLSPSLSLLVRQDLTYARGLEPVTLLEVQHIEFQRRRHIVTSSLPPATDEASLRLRKRILENLELQVGHLL